MRRWLHVVQDGNLCGRADAVGNNQVGADRRQEDKDIGGEFRMLLLDAQISRNGARLQGPNVSEME